MKNGWGWVAGLGAAGLLVAGAPAYAGGGKSGSTGTTAETKSEQDKTLGGSSMGSKGSTESTQSGAAGTTDPSMGSTGAAGSSSTMGSEHHAAMGSGQNEVTGKVDKIDKSNKELTLSLKVSDSTQVLKDGQSASLTDIKEGDQVRASFSGTGESLQVTKIEIMSAGAAGSTGSTGSSSDLGTSGSTGTSTDPGKAKTGLETPPASGSTGSSSPSDKSGSSGGRGY